MGSSTAVSKDATLPGMLSVRDMEVYELLRLPWLRNDISAVLVGLMKALWP